MLSPGPARMVYQSIPSKSLRVPRWERLFVFATTTSLHLADLTLDRHRRDTYCFQHLCERAGEVAREVLRIAAGHQHGEA